MPRREWAGPVMCHARRFANEMAAIAISIPCRSLPRVALRATEEDVLCTIANRGSVGTSHA